MDDNTNTVTGLPPAGYSREEELRKRLDDLAEKSEVKAEQLDVNTIDPKALRPDRELQHLIRDYDALEVTKKQDGYVYCWAYTGQHGQDIMRKKAKGWAVVQGNDPESREHRYEDTTRRVGDVILMRIRMDQHFVLEQHEERKRRMRESGAISEVKELGAKHGFKVHTDIQSSPYFSSAQKTDVSVGAKQVALSRVDKMLREGSVPGMEVPDK